MRLTFLIVIVLILHSCDKQKRVANKLSGEWEIVSYKLTDPEGLIEYSSGSGFLTFEECENQPTPCPYSMNIQYDFPSSSGSLIQNGTFEVIAKGDYMTVTTLDSSNTVTSTYTYRILTQTKTDLQLEFSDTLSQIHSFIFKRKK